MRRQMKKDSIAIVPCSRNLGLPSVLSLPLSFLTPKTASHQ